MHKYWIAFRLNIEDQMQRRASLVLERIRSLCLVLSLYFLWTSLLAESDKFLGYSRKQMITYVLGLALLRALILTNRAFELAWEIGRGRLSAQMLKPLNIFAYQFSMDISDKILRLFSAIVEISILVWIFNAGFYVPQNPASFFLASLAAGMGLVLYFFIGLSLAASGFWSSESVGFMWAASLVMEFSSGAFFPLDVLPKGLTEFLMHLPFPYLVYFPLNIYLERIDGTAIAQGLCIQTAWIAGFYLLVKWLWNKGMSNYQAEGG